MKWIVRGEEDFQPADLRDAGRKGPGGFVLLDPDALMEPRPRPPAIIAPFLHERSVCFLGGYSASYKTWLAMSAAICVATGRPWLGQFECRKGKVAYLAWEGNDELYAERFRNLVHGFKLSGLRSPDFSVCTRPGSALTDPSFEERLRELAREYDVIIIDSFSAAVRNIDENSSAIREPIDVLHQIANDENCSFLVIHHTGKGAGKGKQKRAPREALRGSGAIFSAADEVLLVERDDEKDRVEIGHWKCRVSKEHSPFFVALRQISKPIGAVTFEVVDLSAEKAQVEKQKRIAFRKAVLSFVDEHPGCSKDDVRKGVHKSRQDTSQLVDRLIDGGKLEDRGNSRCAALHSVRRDKRATQ